MAERHDHDLDRALRSTLQRIDRQLTRICSDTGTLDPDRVVDELRRETSHMEQLVEEIVAKRGGSASACALNRILQEASQEVLSCLTFPVVIQSDLVRDAVPVLLHPEPLKALLRRILLLSCGHAGLGGEVRLSTGIEEGQAWLQLKARPGTETATPQGPVNLRYRSVEKFVASLGGHLHVELQPDGTLELRLRLRAGVERV